MLALAIVGLATGAGVLVWHTILAPFARILELSEEHNQSDWTAGRTALNNSRRAPSSIHTDYPSENLSISDWRRLKMSR
jgi:hypothetical protein